MAKSSVKIIPTRCTLVFGCA